MRRLLAGVGVLGDAQDEVVQTQRARLDDYLREWTADPVRFVLQALNASPDPWQCDGLDAIAEYPSVAFRACHGVGKSSLLAWAILWFIVTRQFCRIPTTAPTFNKQVRDVLWAEIHKWWGRAIETNPILDQQFELSTVRMAHRQYPETWFAVGIASAKPINMEGYHARSVMVVFDEAKGIPRPAWESVHGMRAGQESKFVVASTPGAKSGEFYKVFTEYRQTWPRLFVIHPESLRTEMGKPATLSYSRPARVRLGLPAPAGGTYYSARVPDWWVQERRLEWGPDNPVYIARVKGEFPDIVGDVLIPYQWLEDARAREIGAPGPRVVACDVARFGRDRTAFLVGEGGTLLHGETVAQVPGETTAPEGLAIRPGEAVNKRWGRSEIVTADICCRLRMQYNAAQIVIDDGGLGGGVTTLLKYRGENVLPLNFGTAPTDKPRDADIREWRERRHLVDTQFSNIKAQIGWAVRKAFEDGLLALGTMREGGPPDRDTQEAFLTNLIAQASQVRRDLDGTGRLKLVDPDETDEYALAAGEIEGRRSPDHFHALLLYWYGVSGIGRAEPRVVSGEGAWAGPAGVARLGRQPVGVGAQPGRPLGVAAGVGGQAEWVRRWYR